MDAKLRTFKTLALSETRAQYLSALIEKQLAKDKFEETCKLYWSKGYHSGPSVFETLQDMLLAGNHFEHAKKMHRKALASFGKKNREE
jgi:hypothetical protein